MTIVVLDANTVIMHGQAFPDRVRTAVEGGVTLVLPRSVKQELVDDVLATDEAPDNHRDSAEAIQELIDEGFLVIRTPDFETYGHVIDEARRRIADDTLPEHQVKADQYIPALVCELATDRTVQLVTADTKLRDTVRDIAIRHEIREDVLALADGVDTLVHECAYPDGVDSSGHTTPTELATHLQGIDVNRVYLTHLFPSAEAESQAIRDTVSDRIDATVEIASDRETVVID